MKHPANRLKRLLLSALLMPLTGSLFGSSTQFYFDNISPPKDLSALTVKGMAQDTVGFLWLATAEGLVRYDGHEAKIFRSSQTDTTSLPVSNINCVKLAPTGELWVGTDKGLVRYNAPANNFERLHPINDPANLLSNLRMRTLYFDRVGTLWIGTLEGLVCYNLQKNSVKHIVFDEANILNNEIRAITEDDRGFIWLGCYDGLYKLDPAEDAVKRYNLGEKLPDDPDNHLISQLWIDPKNDSRMYIASARGLYLFNIREERVEAHYRRGSGPAALSDDEVRCLLPYDDNLLLLGTDAGLNIFDKESHSFRIYDYNPNKVNTIGNDRVYSMLEDRSGVIWLGTKNWLSSINKEREKINISDIWTEDGERPKRAVINSITMDQNSNVWLGTENGIYRYAPDLASHRFYAFGQSGLSHRIVRKVMTDSRGILWVATVNGVNYYDPTIDRFVAVDPGTHEYTLKYVYNLKEDLDGNILANISNGLCRIRPHLDARGHISHITCTAISLDEIIQINNNDIRCYEVDSRGNIWIGIPSTGLVCCHPDGTFTKYVATPSDRNSLPSNSVYALFADSHDRLWISTEAGVAMFDQQSGLFTCYSDDVDLSKFMRSIVEDTDHNIWLSTASELIRFNPESREKTIIRLYGQPGAMGFNYDSEFRDANGMLYFGGNGFIVSFDPRQIVKREFPAPVVISSLRVFNRDITPATRIGRHRAVECAIPYARRVRLDHRSNNLLFNFALIDYASPQANRYRYILEGYEDRWTTIGDGEHSAAYNNVPPGRYTFRVQGFAPDGTPGSKIRELEVHITHPWWASTAARIVYLLLCIGLFYLLYNVGKARIRLMKALEMEKIERQKTEELNHIKLKFFTNISHELKTPLTLILGPIEKLYSESEREEHRAILKMMERNGQHLLRLTNQIMDLRRLDTNRLQLELSTGDIVKFVHDIWSSFENHAALRRINYTFTSEREELYFNFDRDKLEKIVTNILSNAFKFTESEGNITLDMHFERPADRWQISIRISDTGCGIPEPEMLYVFDRFYQGSIKPVESIQGSGIGLELSKEFTALHNGELTIESREGEGTSVTIRIPDNQLRPTENRSGDSSPETEEPQDAETGMQTDRMKVLVIDDNQELCAFIRLNLEPAYQVFEASDGDMGWNLIQEISPNLIVSDVMMPGLNGFELCAKVKENVLTSHIPVILLTARSDEQSRYKGYDAGADAYIAKPFGIKIFQLRIAKLIEHRRRLHEKYRTLVMSEPTDVAAESRDEAFLRKLMELIEESIDDSELNVPKLCDKAGYSHQQVYKKVKGLTGQTLNEFIRSVRMKRAAQLLRDSDMIISEVMYAVGFDNRSYFAKCFYNTFGCSPKEYAAKYNKHKIKE